MKAWRNEANRQESKHEAKIKSNRKRELNQKTERRSNNNCRKKTIKERKTVLVISVPIFLPSFLALWESSQICFFLCSRQIEHISISLLPCNTKSKEGAERKGRSRLLSYPFLCFLHITLANKPRLSQPNTHQWDLAFPCIYHTGWPLPATAAWVKELLLSFLILHSHYLR